MMIHRLKTWPPFFEDVKRGRKKCEYRFDDRGFNPGDYLLLEEWSPDSREYTGCALLVVVIHVLAHDDIETLPEGFVLMSIELVKTSLAEFITENMLKEEEE